MPLLPADSTAVEDAGRPATRRIRLERTDEGEQFVIRRKANALIKKAFDENGIKFALARVHVAQQ